MNKKLTNDDWTVFINGKTIISACEAFERYNDFRIFFFLRLISISVGAIRVHTFCDKNNILRI